MNVNYFNIKLSHKVYCIIRTESRFFEILESKTLSDGCVNGLIPDAIPIPDSTVAGLVAQAEKQQQNTRGKASRIRRFQKAVVA